MLCVTLLILVFKEPWAPEVGLGRVRISGAAKFASCSENTEAFEIHFNLFFQLVNFNLMNGLSKVVCLKLFYINFGGKISFSFQGQLIPQANYNTCCLVCLHTRAGKPR